MNPMLPRSCLLPLLAGVAIAQAAMPDYGHSRTRALAALGKLPTPTDVAIADIVDFHRHRLPLPRAGEAVALDLRAGSRQFDRRGEAVLQIGLTAAAVGEGRELPPLCLGLVIDCSGSMAAAGKLDACKEALRVLVRRLRPSDYVALVTYSDTATLRASDTLGDGQGLLASIDALRPGGATNLHAGLMQGLREVRAHAQSGGHNRVILLTDGIANRGETDPAAILQQARAFTRQDVDLATIGVGAELNVELLDRLARGARGMFHFVADAADVQKVFVQEIEAQLSTVARDVRLSLQLPPDLEVVRVFGYEPHGDGDGGIDLRLPDLNAGATAVIMVQVRHRAGAELGGPLHAQAALGFGGAAGGARQTLQQVVTLAGEHGGDPLDDAEVRKNYTIAVLAQGMHDMAACAEQCRWADADRALGAALDFAHRQFPSAEDVDYRRVLDMAEAYSRTLGGYVDRFRDF